MNYTQNNKTNLLIEFGHVYTDEQPSDLHFKTAELGALVKEIASELSIKKNKEVNVMDMLFVDNYNPSFSKEYSGPSFCIDSYVSQLNDITGSKLSTSKNNVVYEAKMVEKADNIIMKLIDLNSVELTNKDGEEWLVYNGGDTKSKKVNLYNFNDNRYSCAVLDAALYETKLAQSDLCVTILPGKKSIYKSQQKNTKAILSAIDINTSGIQDFYVPSTDLDMGSYQSNVTKFLNKNI